MLPRHRPTSEATRWRQQAIGRRGRRDTHFGPGQAGAWKCDRQDLEVARCKPARHQFVRPPESTGW
jgi:hypothetical protein